MLQFMNQQPNFLFEIFGLNRKFLVYHLVERNLKLKYRKSMLGILWTMLVPASTAAVYFLVFQFVMKVQIENYLLFILTGVLPWTFFSGTIAQGTECIVTNLGLVNKVPIPAFVFPYTEALTAFINLLFATPVVFVVMLLTNSPLTWALLQVPVLLFFLFMMAYNLAIMCSLLFVYFRDLRHIISIVLQLWFYLTPILYRVEMIPEKYHPLLLLNPIGPLFNGLHQSIVYGQTLGLNDWAAVMAWTLVFFSLSYYFVRILFDRVAEHL